jgi:hypothetical protein
MVLGTIARTTVAPATIRLLAATEWQNFNADDWISLLATVDDGSFQLLGQLDTISPLLVRQLGNIPSAFRQVNIFNVLNTLMVPSIRWQKLAIAITKAGQAPEGHRDSEHPVGR